MAAHQRLVRRAALTRLKGFGGLIALVPAGSIHPQAPLTPPTWPFLKLGPPQTLPRTAACLDGAFVNFGVHAFSRAVLDGGGAMTMTAEDAAGLIGEQIELALHKRGDTLPAGAGNVAYMIRDRNLRLDAEEPDAFHYSCTVRAKVTA